MGADRLALDADVDRLAVRVVLLAALRVLEAVLDRISLATDRVELRGFLKEHPEVRLYYPDGERSD